MNAIEAGTLCDTTFSALHDGTQTLGSIPGLIKRIIKEEAWKSRKVKMHGIVELAGLRELITTKPLIGWGEDPAKIEALLRDDPEALTLYTEAMTGKKHVHYADASNRSITSKPTAGTTKSSGLRRLHRQAPALHAKVVAGELSVNAACIKAGFRKPTFTIPADVDGAVGALRRHFTAADVRKIKEAL